MGGRNIKVGDDVGGMIESRNRLECAVRWRPPEGSLGCSNRFQPLQQERKALNVLQLVQTASQEVPLLKTRRGAYVYGRERKGCLAEAFTRFLKSAGGT